LKLSEEEKQKRLSEYSSGESTYQIAERRGVTATTIWLFLKKHGAQLRSKSESRRAHFGSDKLVLDASTYKYCYRCKKIKLLSEFYKAKPKNDGYMDECKKCSNTYTRVWSRKNSEKVKERLRKFREEHLDESLEYSRLYRRTERGKTSAVSSRARRRAALLECEVNDLTTTQIRSMLREAKICSICREAFDLSFKKRKTLDHEVTLSRSGNHTLLNVRIICQSCNSKKGNRAIRSATNQKR